jgi:hypothetical protein
MTVIIQVLLLKWIVNKFPAFMELRGLLTYSQNVTFLHDSQPEKCSSALENQMFKSDCPFESHY